MSNKQLLDVNGARSVLPDNSVALKRLTVEDRAGTLKYLLEKFMDAGKQPDGSFDQDAALEILDPENGSLQLRGSAHQIAAQLVIAEGMSNLLSAFAQYAVDEDAKSIRRGRQKTANAKDETLPKHNSAIDEGPSGRG